jgi:anti-anti-sigma factor
MAIAEPAAGRALGGGGGERRTGEPSMITAWELTVVVLRDGGVLDTLHLSTTPITIGMSPKCDVVLSDPHVSAKHAHVTVSGGRLLLVDSSRNGSFVAGERVETADLGASGEVAIPPFELRLSLEETALAPQTMIFQGDEGAAGTSPEPVAEPREPGRPGTKPATKRTGERRSATRRRTRSAEAPKRPLGTGPRVSRRRPAPAPIPVSIAAQVLIPPPGERGAEPDATVVVSRERPDTPAIRPGVEAAARLTVVKAPKPLLGRVIDLLPAAGSVGRSRDCEYVIDHPTVSRKHLEIRLEGNRWRLRDFASRNASLVNGRQVDEVDLHDGDVVGLGHEVNLRFSLAEPPGATDLLASPATGSLTGGSAAARGGDADRVVVNTGRSATDRRVTVVRVNGRVDGFTYSELRDGLNQVMESGTRAIVVDLAHCGFFDHTGLGVLVSVQSQLASRRGRLIVVGASKRLMEGIALLRIDRMIKVAENEGAAVVELQRMLD